LPKIFHVNWFRLDKNKKFLWPGYGDNIRVLDWILRRINDEDIAVKTPVGLLPKKGSINVDGLKEIDWDELMGVSKDYWLADIQETKKWLVGQLGEDLPNELIRIIEEQEQRLSEIN
ncbi:unnamed protein product, partial [Didymodactylos carnosus]